MIAIGRGLFAVSLVSFVVFPSVLQAATCDPDKILRQDISSYQNDIAVFISYLKNLQTSTDRDESSSFGISYNGIGLNYADAQSLSQYVGLHENYIISRNESTSILRATLSETSVRAYIACLNSQDPVTVIIPDAALNELAFPFTVEWNPNFRTRSGQLTVEVVNGTINGRTTATKRMDPTDSGQFIVKRDGNGSKKLFITANILGKSSDPAFLPGIPQFKILLKPKFAPPPPEPPVNIKRSGHFGTPLVRIDVCVYPDDGSILMPSTLKFVAERIVGDPGRAKAGLHPNGTGQQACGYVENSAGGNTDFNEISGRFVAFQTVRAPVTAVPPGLVAAKAPPALRGEPFTSRYEDIVVLMKEGESSDNVSK